MKIISLLPYLPALIEIGMKAVENVSKIQLDDMSDDELKKFIKIAEGDVKRWNGL